MKAGSLAPGSAEISRASLRNPNQYINHGLARATTVRYNFSRAAVGLAMGNAHLVNACLPDEMPLLIGLPQAQNKICYTMGRAPSCETAGLADACQACGCIT
jgi:hypothetical protein